MKKYRVIETADSVDLLLGEIVTLEEQLGKQLVLVRSERPEVMCLFGQYLQATMLYRLEEVK